LGKTVGRSCNVMDLRRAHSKRNGLIVETDNLKGEFRRK
jgi:hypothetical protein